MNLQLCVLVLLTVSIIGGVASLSRCSKSRAQYAGESNEKQFGGNHFGLLIFVVCVIRINEKYDQVLETPDILPCC